MGTLFRRRKGSGSGKWYGAYFDADGRRRQVALSADRKLARVMLAKLEQDVERRKAGITDRFTAASTLPLTEHLQAYLATLQARNRSKAYLAYVESRCRKLIAGCRLATLNDISAEVVARWLKRQREARRHFGIEISNGYVTVIKGFCRWLWTSGRSIEHRLIGLQKLNAETDRRHRRRALSDADFSRLLETTKTSKLLGKCGTTGRDRYCIYLTAALTGLRAGELRSLRRSDVSLENGTIRVRAAHSKNGRQAALPVHPTLLRVLTEYVAAKRQAADHRFFPQFWRQAEMLKRDLKAAKIPYADAEGSVFDFHALRGQFATMLARADVSLKKAQALMRHSTPTLTANIYTKLTILELAEAVDRLNVPSSRERTSDGIRRRQEVQRSACQASHRA